MISIIIPCYNNANLIKQTVDSIINGTFQDFEILLIDDGSSDNTYEVLKELTINDSRIKAYHIEHGGVGKARNYGIEIARGEIISFIDSDDTVDSRYYELLYSKMMEGNYDWVYCGHNQINNNTIKSYQIFKSDIVLTKNEINELIPLLFISKDSKDMLGLGSMSMSLYKKHIIDKYNIRVQEDIEIGEDLIFNYEYANHIDSFYYLSLPLYNYINVSTSKTNRLSQEEIIEATLKYINRLEEIRNKNKWSLYPREIVYATNHLLKIIKKLSNSSNIGSFNDKMLSFDKTLNNNVYIKQLLNENKSLETFYWHFYPIKLFISRKRYKILNYLYKIKNIFN